MKFDRKGIRSQWELVRSADEYYRTKLLQVARQVGALVDGLAPGGIVQDESALLRALAGYADLLGPWARSVASFMVADVARRDECMWRNVGGSIGRGVREELKRKPSGMLYHALMYEQEALIKSLPLEAAQRVHVLTTKGLSDSTRSTTIAKEIMRSGAVTANRAKMIARTEVSRTAASFKQARAMAAGSPGYIWRTSADADVRDTHKAMEGVYVPWDDPPKTDASLAPYHAGCGPNCRCFAEPVLPDL